MRDEGGTAAAVAATAKENNFCPRQEVQRREDKGKRAGKSSCESIKQANPLERQKAAVAVAVAATVAATAATAT